MFHVGVIVKEEGWVRRYVDVFRYTRRAISLVWETSAWLTISFAALTVFGGVLPTAMAWVGKEVIDAVLLAIETKETTEVIFWIALEASLVTLSVALIKNLSLDEASEIVARFSSATKGNDEPKQINKRPS